jgi:FkbM family methyltransferase
MPKTKPTDDQARHDFFTAAAEVTPFVGVESRGAQFIVSTWDQTVGRSLFVRRTRGEMGLLGQALDVLAKLGLPADMEGTTFVDVGANVGTTTITALVHHGFGTALCLEPDATNVRVLRANLALNGLERRARVLPVAASDAGGTSELFVSIRNSGGHMVRTTGPMPRETERLEEGWRFVGIETLSLDFLVARGLLDPADVGLLWMDVQGHEGHVLRGAERLGEPGIPVVLEYYPAILEGAGSLAYLETFAAAHYTDFVDLRHAGGKTVHTRPVAELPAFARGYEPHTERRFTDLLLVRREPDAAG